MFAKQFCNTNSALLGNVKYDINEQKKIVSEMFGLYESSTENPQEKMCSLFLWLAVVFPLLKEDIDQKDNECRIITAEHRDRFDPKKLIGKSCVKEIKFELDNIIISRMRS